MSKSDYERYVEHFGRPLEIERRQRLLDEEPTPVQDNPVPEHNQEHHRNGTKKKSWEKK